MALPKTFSELFLEAEKASLYGKLVLQLNKDLQRAAVEMLFDVGIPAERLKVGLQELVYNLISHRFTDLLNLLYIIDVPESAVKQLDGSDALKLSETITFLVLKREWEKVWYKNKL